MVGSKFTLYVRSKQAKQAHHEAAGIEGCEHALLTTVSWPIPSFHEVGSARLGGKSKNAISYARKSIKRANTTNKLL